MLNVEMFLNIYIAVNPLFVLSFYSTTIGYCQEFKFYEKRFLL